MIDLAKTVEAKIDQLTADELLGGPRKITITKVTGNEETEQPVSIHFEGDQGKPFKPCKTVRRVLMHMWGRDASTFVGRQLVLYRDEAVKFGGLQVGGVRVSHASHIEREMTIPVTVKQGRKAPVKVKPLKAETVALKVVEKPVNSDSSKNDYEPTKTITDPDTPAFDIAEFEGIVDLAIANMGAEFPTWWDEQYDVRKQAAGVDATKARAIAKKANDYIESLKGEI